MLEPPLVRLEHPELPGQHIDVPESAVSIHQNSGWVPAGGEPPASTGSTEAEPSGAGGGEPAEDTTESASSSKARGRAAAKDKE
ncbi:MAG: hypothetical protein ACJ72N_06865 [Labedaea sp.]